MLKAYKYRIYPNKEQEEYLAKCFGCTRFIYNKMLADKIEYYKETGEMLKNTPAQYKKEFKWLKEVDSLALANAQQNLEKAYKNFFRDKSVGFPKFKSKKTNRYSYTTNNQKGTIYIDKMYLHQVLGDDILNKLMYRGDITSLKVGFYNDFKIKSNIPLLLCQFKIKATSNYITKMKYEEDDDNLIIRWTPVDAL